MDIARDFDKRHRKAGLAARTNENEKRSLGNQPLLETRHTVLSKLPFGYRKAPGTV